MRLIDADKLEIRKLAEFTDEYGDIVPVYGVAAEDIDNAPTVDAIVLPVKVGQTVHILSKHDKVIILTAVEWILQGRDEMVYSTGDYEFDNTDIGKTVFFTYAEAEAALKVRENSDE